MAYLQKLIKIIAIHLIVIVLVINYNRSFSQTLGKASVVIDTNNVCHANVNNDFDYNLIHGFLQAKFNWPYLQDCIFASRNILTKTNKHQFYLRNLVNIDSLYNEYTNREIFKTKEQLKYIAYASGINYYLKANGQSIPITIVDDKDLVIGYFLQLLNQLIADNKYAVGNYIFNEFKYNKREFFSIVSEKDTFLTPVFFVSKFVKSICVSSYNSMYNTTVFDIIKPFYIAQSITTKFKTEFSFTEHDLNENKKMLYKKYSIAKKANGKKAKFAMSYFSNYVILMQDNNIFNTINIIGLELFNKEENLYNANFLTVLEQNKITSKHIFLNKLDYLPIAKEYIFFNKQ